MNRVLFAILFVQIAAACAWPIRSQAPQSEAQANGEIWAANLGDEAVGPDDLIYITVEGSPELTRSYRISAEGAITLPISDAELKVAGQTPPVVARAVARSLVEDHVLVAPVVSVAVLDYRSRRVSVVGAVRSPAVMPAVGNLRLLDAIAHAQGIAPEAGPELIVTRNESAGHAAGPIRIPIKDLLSGQDPELNLILHGGEEIRVPEAPKLFIVGNVRNPGAYPLNEMGGTTLLKALAMSQGVLSFTARNAYVYRESAGSGRQEIAVPLREILHRKSPDIGLLPNDILYIPENTKAHLSADVLDKIANFGGSTASGLIIWR